MIRIHIKVIPHNEQRYPTVGDWQWRGKNEIGITVSDLKNSDMEFLIALHEQVEVFLCRKRGICQDTVDTFDMEYEARRKEGDETEPGDSPMAPYNKEHVFATKIEKMMAKELGIDWKEYEDKINSL